MARVPITKKLVNTELANGYGGWIYCEGCRQTIGYLCYVTYDHFALRYECTCGGEGSIHLAFTEEPPAQESGEALVKIKNRLCCPRDQSPLLTVNDKRLKSYRYEVVCQACRTKYTGESGT